MKPMDKDKIRLMNLRKQIWQKVREGATTVSLLAIIQEMNNLTDNRIDRRTDRRTDRQTDRKTDRQTNGQTY